MSDYSTTGAKNGRDYGARHSVLRDSIVLRHGCVLAYGQRAPRAPHRKCRRISLRYFNREVQPRSHPRNPGTNQPRIYRPRRFFKQRSSMGLLLKIIKIERSIFWKFLSKYSFVCISNETKKEQTHSFSLTTTWAIYKHQILLAQFVTEWF